VAQFEELQRFSKHGVRVGGGEREVSHDGVVERRDGRPRQPRPHFLERWEENRIKRESKALLLCHKYPLQTTP
jgi:hypothetical protein